MEPEKKKERSQPPPRPTRHFGDRLSRDQQGPHYFSKKILPTPRYLDTLGAQHKFWKFHQWKFENINQALDIENKLVSEDLLDSIHTFASKIVDQDSSLRFDRYRACGLYAVAILISEWILHVTGTQVTELDQTIQMWSSVSRYYDHLLLKKRHAQKVNLESLSLFKDLVRPLDQVQQAVIRGNEQNKKKKKKKKTDRKASKPESVLVKRPRETRQDDSSDNASKRRKLMVFTSSNILDGVRTGE